jgi:hypothetical protein
MSASRSRGRCRHYKGIRYRSQAQARKGRDRTRAEQARVGVPAPLRVASWYRCPACRGWHLHADQVAARAFLAGLNRTTSAIVAELAAA